MSNSTKGRLLLVAARIFAQKGFTRATTREICSAAEINITAIHYYFKDKTGLYRAVFGEPFKNMPKPFFGDVLLANTPLKDRMYFFYSVLLKPFMDDRKFRELHASHEMMHYSHELHAREQFEPTGLVDDLVAKPAIDIHNPLNMLICQYLGLSEVDSEVHRLSFAIVGLGFSLIHPRLIVKSAAPELITRDGWEQELLDNVSNYALALLNYELERRRHNK